jgi:hypothetical protein
VINVDEVDAGGFLAKADLPRSGVADLHVFPLEDLGPSDLMDSDRVRHGRQMGARSRKEKPRRGKPWRGST